MNNLNRKGLTNDIPDFYKFGELSTEASNAECE